MFFVATFPTTWLLMLFLGSFELGLSYWGALPGGLLISLLLSSGASSDGVTTLRIARNGIEIVQRSPTRRCNVSPEI